MKKTKKMKNPLELGTHEWCPLFGPLPKIEYHNHLQGLCIDIIEKVRRIWGVDEFGPIRYGLKSKNYRALPRYEDVPDYPTVDLSTARAIFAAHGSTTQHVLSPSDTLDMKYSQAIDFIKTFHYDYQFSPDIPDLHIIGMFALAEAWSVLKDLLLHGEQEDNPNVLRSLIVALNLLLIARERHLTPYLEGHIRKLEGIESGQQTRNETNECKWEIWQDMATAVWNRNKSLSNTKVAALVKENLRKTDQTEFIASVQAIRKRIKNPYR